MRGESRNDHPLDVLSLSQLGPAYFLAPDADPIGRTDEVDGSTEASGLPLTRRLRALATTRHRW